MLAYKMAVLSYKIWGTWPLSEGAGQRIWERKSSGKLQGQSLGLVSDVDRVERFRLTLRFFDDASDFSVCSFYVWLDGTVVRALDLRLKGRGFKSQPLHCRLQPWTSCSHTLSSASGATTIWRYTNQFNLFKKWQKNPECGRLSRPALWSTFGRTIK